MPDLELIREGLMQDKPQMVKSALDLGFRVDDPILQGQTTLYLAAYRDKPAVADLLIRRGANVESVFEDQTPLMAAAQNGSFVTAVILLKAGANVDGCSVDGTTSLMLATSGNHQSMIRLLLENNANTHAKNNAGDTVFDLVRASQNQELHVLFEDSSKVARPEEGGAGKGSSDPQTQKDIDLISTVPTPHEDLVPEEGMSWQERALLVVGGSLHGQSYRINVYDEEQRNVLLDLYREDARQRGVNVFDIDCEDATGSDFLGERIFDERDKAVRSREYPAYWTDQNTIVFVHNIPAIQDSAIHAIRFVCDLYNRREMEKKWVMILVVTPKERVHASLVLSEATENYFDLVEMGWMENS